LRCLKRSNSDYTKFTPIPRLRTSSNEEDKLKAMKNLAKTPHSSRFKDYRKRTKSGKLDPPEYFTNKLDL